VICAFVNTPGFNSVQGERDYAGWRLYYAQEGRCVYLLLSAGSKASQRKDIEQALALWQQVKGDST